VDRYKALGTVAGKELPKALIESEQLAKPIFTPRRKPNRATTRTSAARSSRALIGTELARELERLTLALYGFAHDFAASKGLILADTKFEFGMYDGHITLIDES